MTSNSSLERAIGREAPNAASAEIAPCGPYCGTPCGEEPRLPETGVRALSDGMAEIAELLVDEEEAVGEESAGEGSGPGAGEGTRFASYTTIVIALLALAAALLTWRSVVLEGRGADADQQVTGEALSVSMSQMAADQLVTAESGANARSGAAGVVARQLQQLLAAPAAGDTGRVQQEVVAQLAAAAASASSVTPAASPGAAFDPEARRRQLLSGNPYVAAELNPLAVEAKADHLHRVGRRMLLAVLALALLAFVATAAHLFATRIRVGVATATLVLGAIVVPVSWVTFR